MTVILPKSFAVINTGERGILVTFNKVQDLVLNEGTHPIVPFVSSVRVMNIRIQRTDVEANARTKDLQRITTKVALNWQISPDKIQQVYQQFGNNEELVARIITPVLEEIVKARIPARSLEKNLIERTELKQELETKAKQRLESYGIVITDLSVLNVTASDEFNKATEEKQIAEQKSISDKQIAEQKALSDKMVAEQELQKADFESKKAAKDAETAIARARGQAESQKLLQTSLSPEILQKQAIEKWDGKFPVVMSSNGALPFINVNAPTSNPEPNK
ncbi:prohibitin family protein [Pseudanabaena sp. FACHB-1998]|uniref:prohibitin family protein n=1 Tax=Pseudanabaena sp. FACHB-1998 TaxID=2692858 RepID=UPI0018EF79AC|nr:prohibitin family protein [Pseudanabaena sp. FACHB-1998]